MSLASGLASANRLRSCLPLRMSNPLAPPVVDAAGLEKRPFVDGRKVLCNGKVTPWTGAVQEVFAPIYKARAASPPAPSPAPTPTTNAPEHHTGRAHIARAVGEGTLWGGALL